MKSGRVIGGDEHDARTLAQQLVDEARADAERIKAAARAEAERAIASAQGEAMKLRDDARVLANELVRGARDTGKMAAFVDTPAVGTEAAGHVDEVVGLVIRATVSGVALGEVVRVDRRGASPLAAEVVGFRGEQAVLLPLGELAGVAPAGAVWRTGEPLMMRAGDDLLGRVLDGLGAPIDGGAALTGERWAVDRPAPPALERPPISTPLPTGVRVLDAMLTFGRGQRVGLFAAAGVGKSTLLGQIARNAAADVIVLCLVGERGRELAEFLGDELAPARARTVVVARPAMRRRWSGCARSTPRPPPPSGSATSAAPMSSCSSIR